jgi:hypothetical protein
MGPWAAFFVYCNEAAIQTRLSAHGSAGYDGNALTRCAEWSLARKVESCVLDCLPSCYDGELREAIYQIAARRLKMFICPEPSNLGSILKT